MPFIDRSRLTKKGIELHTLQYVPVIQMHPIAKRNARTAKWE